LLFRCTVLRAAAARMRRTASTSAGAKSSGSPSQPCPKLTTPSGTRATCESASAASSAPLGGLARRSWLARKDPSGWSEMQPTHCALQALLEGSGAS
jgi:hypothetical protein